jgi:hypothetical protein
MDPEKDDNAGNENAHRFPFLDSAPPGITCRAFLGKTIERTGKFRGSRIKESGSEALK